MSEYDDQINVEVTSDAKQLAKKKLGHGGLSRKIREVLQQVAYGEEVSRHTQLEERLRSLREKKDELRADRREIEGDIQDVEQEITRTEEQLSQLDKREDKYDAALEMLEETLYAGGRVYPEHGQVQRAARLGGVQPSNVIDALQNRNPSVPEFAFVDGLHDDHEWDGVDRTEVEQ